ncbi:MAG: M20/M25/M40 family metallo-hydrolase, partial [Spirochaetota bacterium]|nr:M20/M25/M40 family metallo-hydrolase [Spirochaetota bacterium]
MDIYQSFIDNSEDFIIGLQTRLTAAQAMAPENGGTGEYTKVNILKNILTGLNFENFEEIQAPDDRVPCNFRPSLLVTLKGKNSSKALWIISHLDVVPPGDKQLWHTDPFKATVKDGKIYGRGTEDNQQGIVASLVAAKALLHNKITPQIDIKLLFVADEEVGSKYGIDWI